MATLVTGGAGFIGSSCAAELLSRGREVIVYDSFESTLYERPQKEQNLAWLETFGEFTFVEADIRDREHLTQLFERRDIEQILHLAAVAGVRHSIENGRYYFDINVGGTSVLLETARRFDVGDIVLASSSSVYGDRSDIPFSERDPLQPASPYAASKRSKETLARTHHRMYGGNITCLRFFSVYGPRQRPDMAIHKFMRRLDRGAEIPMYGDGSSARDYTFIGDVVDGVMAAMETNDGFRIYNLGESELVYLRELIDTLGEVTGISPTIDQLPEQPGDVQYTLADIGRAERELGYSPEVSIREGLGRMWEWYRSVGRNIPEAA